MKLTVEHTVKRLYTLEMPDGVALDELQEQIRDYPWDWEDVHEQFSKATAAEPCLELHLRH